MGRGPGSNRVSNRAPRALSSVVWTRIMVGVTGSHGERIVALLR